MRIYVDFFLQNDYNLIINIKNFTLLLQSKRNRILWRSKYHENEVEDEVT